MNIHIVHFACNYHQWRIILVCELSAGGQYTMHRFDIFTLCKVL